jgi:hypothetical protein
MVPLLYAFFHLCCGIEARGLPIPQVFWQAHHYVCQWSAMDTYARYHAEAPARSKGLEQAIMRGSHTRTHSNSPSYCAQ